MESSHVSVAYQSFISCGHCLLNFLIPMATTSPLFRCQEYHYTQILFSLNGSCLPLSSPKSHTPTHALKYTFLVRRRNSEYLFRTFLIKCRSPATFAVMFFNHHPYNRRLSPSSGDWWGRENRQSSSRGCLWNLTRWFTIVFEMSPTRGMSPFYADYVAKFVRLVCHRLRLLCFHGDIQIFANKKRRAEMGVVVVLII